MTSLLVGLGCFTLHAAVTLVWLRVPGRTPPVARHAGSALATHALGVSLAAQFAGPFAYWPAAAVSGFLAVCWLFAFSAVYKSVSLRILTQLDRTPGHALPLQTVTEEHVRPEFAARVALLVKTGCAAEVDGAYEVTGKGTATARRIRAIQHACGIEASGLYGDPGSAGVPPACACGSVTNGTTAEAYEPTSPGGPAARTPGEPITSARGR